MEEAKSTRQKNADFRRQLRQKEREERETVRKALFRVLERADAVPAEILEAVRLLKEIGQ